MGILMNWITVAFFSVILKKVNKENNTCFQPEFVLKSRCHKNDRVNLTMCSLPYRWQHHRHGKLNTSRSSNRCFYEICVINCIFKVITAGTSLCFLQFSALYPEMVDGIIVLDVFGFVPTDPVLQHYFSSLLEKNNNNLIVGKMQNYFIKLSLWATPVCVCVSHLSFYRRKKFPESWGRGWRRCSSLKKRQKRRRGFTRTRRRWRGIALFYSQFKWSKPFVYVFVQKWSEALLLSSCNWTAGNHCG